MAESTVLSRMRTSHDEAAEEVETAVRRHAQLVYRVAYSALQNAHDAEDATQDTFLRLLRYRASLARADDPRAFVCRVAWRVALDRLRRRKRRGEVPVEQASERLRGMWQQGRTTEEIAASREMHALLERLIAKLPGKLRDAVRLSTVAELSAAQVAEILRIPESSVRTRLFRARKLLHKKVASLTTVRRDRST